MKSFKLKLVIVLTIIVGLSCASPVYAQSWKKVAVEKAEQILKKSLQKGETKLTTQQAAKIASRNLELTSKQEAEFMAYISQHLYVVTCPTCSGYGAVNYYGQICTCPNCNGSGRVLVWR